MENESVLNTRKSAKSTNDDVDIDDMAVENLGDLTDLDSLMQP